MLRQLAHPLFVGCRADKSAPGLHTTPGA